MNRMRIGGLAAGMFGVGLLTGLAGTAVARTKPSRPIALLPYPTTCPTRT
jgi:hypothetical protein